MSLFPRRDSQRGARIADLQLEGAAAHPVGDLMSPGQVVWDARRAPGESHAFGIRIVAAKITLPKRRVLLLDASESRPTTHGLDRVMRPRVSERDRLIRSPPVHRLLRGQPSASCPVLCGPHQNLRDVRRFRSKRARLRMYLQSLLDVPERIVLENLKGESQRLT